MQTSPERIASVSEVGRDIGRMFCPRIDAECDVCIRHREVVNAVAHVKMRDGGGAESLGRVSAYES